MSGPDTPAGRELLRRHPELGAGDVTEVELQARGRGVQADKDRREQVLDRLRHLLTDDQRGAANAVLTLDPDAIASFDDEKLGSILRGLSDPRLTPSLDRAAREAASEESRRRLTDIM